MRVYHFLPAHHALDDIRTKRIKISEVDKLNDPFELWCSAQEDRELRKVLRNWKSEVAQKFGITSFCRHWHNPVLWSHYADRHHGMCLGFDVAEGLLKEVEYVGERLPLQLPPTQATMEKLLYTKYRDWCYEQELRAWLSLEERDPVTGHYFYGFDEKMQLREVIAGPLCDIPKTTIDAAVENYGQMIRVTKSRLAFRTFQIVEDRRGFRN